MDKETKKEITPVDFPVLKTGDRAPFRQMTFTLHDRQHANVLVAIKRCKALGAFDGENKNSNGNALARICERFVDELDS